MRRSNEKVLVSPILILVFTVMATFGVEPFLDAGDWERLADLPNPYSFTGTAPLAVLDGQIYALCGTGGPYPDTTGCRDFWRFNPSDNTWTRLADLPENTNFYGGPTLVATADSIFAHPGGFWYLHWLWRYNPGADSWQQVTIAPPNVDVEFGTSMAWAGGDHIYANFRYADDGFHRLHIPSRVWEKLPNPPFNLASPSMVGTGSSLIWTGGDHLYLNRGVGYPWWPPHGPALARYSISNGSWTSLAPPPVAISSGMVWDGADVLYGRSDTSVYRYSILNDSWSSAADFPVAGPAPDFDLVMAGGALYSAETRFSPGFWYLGLNQPPVALCKDILLEAGPGCLASGSVDAASYDPDGDAILISQNPDCPWGLGEVDVNLTIEDSFGATDACVGTALVVDSTPPVISCNASATITPRDVPTAFTVSVDDYCGATAEILGYDCWALNPAGRRVSKLDGCVVSLSGDTVTIHESGGIGATIEWFVIATDSSGNSTEATCSTVVVRPGTS